MSEDTSPLLETTYGSIQKYAATYERLQFFFVGFCFFFFGFATLFPWNAFITAYDYFYRLYPSFPVEFGMSIAYNVSGIPILLFLIKFGRRIPFQLRMTVPPVVNFALLIAIPQICQHVSDTKISLWITLAAVCLCGVVTNLYFGTLLGLSAQFPSGYITASMSGIGLGGMAVGVIRLITFFALPSNDEGYRKTAYIYFGAAAGVQLVAGVLFWLMLWTSAYAREHLIERPRQSQAQLQAKRLAQGKECDANHDHVSYRSLAKRLWKEMFCAFFVFFVTLSLFPGITVTIPTQHTHDERFQSLFPVLLIFIFQVGDLVGRSLPSLVILVGPRYLWICVVARIAFFILFILCINPRVFDNDWAAYVIEAVFAVTNGYFGTLATIYGPAPAEEHEKEVAGNIMSFCLQFGVLTGAFFALLVLYLVNGKLTLS